MEIDGAYEVPVYGYNCIKVLLGCVRGHSDAPRLYYV